MTAAGSLCSAATGQVLLVRRPAATRSRSPLPLSAEVRRASRPAVVVTSSRRGAFPGARLLVCRVPALSTDAISGWQRTHALQWLRGIEMAVDSEDRIRLNH